MGRGDRMFGDPSLVAEMRAMRAKGNLIAWRRRWLDEEHGAAAVEEVASRLGGEAREYLLDPPSHFAWKPLGPMMDLDRAIVEGPMRGDLDEMHRFGAHIGAGDFSTVYKLIVRLAVTPRRLAVRIAHAYDTYFQPGHGFIAEEGPHHAIVGATHTLPLYLCTYGVIGWFTAAIELARAPGGAVEHVACRHRGDPQCLWKFTWD